MCPNKLKTAMQVWPCIAAKRAVKERTIPQMGIAKCYADRYNILVAQFICCAGARNTCAGVQELEPLAHCYVSYLLTLVYHI